MIEVYAHTSPSGKVYVGVASKGMVARWVQHVRATRGGSKLPFHCAIRKYGENTFSHAVLERMITEAGAHRAEKLWIRELGSFGVNGYNATEGGEGMGGVSPSAETRAKMSAAGKGRTFSAEHRARLSVSQRGKKNSAEARKKMSLSHTGKTLSAETRAKMSASGKGKHRESPSAETRAKMSASRLEYLSLRRLNGLNV